MMDFEALFINNSRAVADFVSDIIGDDQEKYRILYDFVKKEENVFAKRASRVLCINAERHPQLFEPYYNDTVRSLENLRTNTVRRCFLKLLTLYPAPEHEEIQGILLDFCFRALPDPGQEIAIRVYSMIILFELSKKIPEIREELRLMIEQAMVHGSAGIKSIGKRLLFKLKKYQY